MISDIGYRRDNKLSLFLSKKKYLYSYEITEISFLVINLPLCKQEIAVHVVIF